MKRQYIIVTENNIHRIKAFQDELNEHASVGFKVKKIKFNEEGLPTWWALMVRKIEE